jgi:crotonobetainyl-CoA:carnitine CoA-transferase CaiB-like acyl-CoA transferase
MLLADAGASVIKLERTGGGDDTRSWGPPFVDTEHHGPISTYFLAVNRRKKSIAVDLKHKEGLEICRRLATEWADVLVENFKGGTTERLGLDYQSLVKDNPGLVYCSISGFGPTGPFANRPGYDVIISGMYGLMSITGDEHGDPARVGVASTDVLTGTLAQSGILSALYERSRTGYGMKVDVSLMETQLSGLVNIASNVLNAPFGTPPPPPKRWGSARESIVPYQAFKCQPNRRDQTEYIMVGAGNDLQFQKLCDSLGIRDLPNDPRFRTNADRVANRSTLVPLLEQHFATKSRDEWVVLLGGKGLPMGPLRTVKEAFECEQVEARGMIEELQHPVIGRIRLPRSPISFSSVFQSGLQKDGAPLVGDKVVFQEQEDAAPPMLGQHTEEVLSQVLGVPNKKMKEMEDMGTIECWRKD